MQGGEQGHACWADSFLHTLLTLTSDSRAEERKEWTSEQELQVWHLKQWIFPHSPASPSHSLPDMLLGHSNVQEQKDTLAEGPWGHAAPSLTFPASKTQHGTSEEMCVLSECVAPAHLLTFLQPAGQ